MQGAIPDVVERLIQLLGGILVDVNQSDLVACRACTPEKRQVIAQPDQGLAQRSNADRPSPSRTARTAPATIVRQRVRFLN